MCIPLLRTVRIILVYLPIAGALVYSPCEAMQHIDSDLQDANDGWVCSTLQPCYTTMCFFNKKSLEITLLRCDTPPSVQMIHKDNNGIFFNHTFHNSESIAVPLDGEEVQLNVSIVHHPDLLGLRVRTWNQFLYHQLRKYVSIT